MNQSILDQQRHYDHPIKIIQFGEGNFLRAFWGKAIHELNNCGTFQGQIYIVQPLPQGNLGVLKDQNCLYNVFLQDKEGEELVLVESIKGGINPYEDYNQFLELALNPDIKFIVSNTTEAGIVLDEEDSLDSTPPKSFPGKLLAFLNARYRAFHGEPGSGFRLFPCELIENNGNELKRILIELAKKFNFEPDFFRWLEVENIFYTTLVDGIVTGYPADEINALQRRLGYTDEVLVKGERYQLLVVEGDRTKCLDLPLEDSSLNVVWTEDLSRYRNLKVKIMNAFQTALSLCGFLCGLETERQALNDPLVGNFMKEGLRNEILPALPYPSEEKEIFTHKILNRLDNPHINHYLRDINLNSFSKFQSRLQPSLDFWGEKGKAPLFLLFCLALTIRFYRVETMRGGTYYGRIGKKEYPLYDTAQNLQILHQINDKAKIENWGYDHLCKEILSESKLWLKIPSLSDEGIKRVAEYLRCMDEQGIKSFLGSMSSGNMI